MIEPVGSSTQIGLAGAADLLRLRIGVRTATATIGAPPSDDPSQNPTNTMTYAEQIPHLPEPQRAAARELLAHPESPEAISHALTVGVPTKIVSFASSRSVHDAEHIAHDLERDERELAARIAEAA